MHIVNYYKDRTILLFKECWALEKIHGTSASVHFFATETCDVVNFSSGGERHEPFVALFDRARLEGQLPQLGLKVTVYGEAYGGKCQAMSDTYGKALRFVVFDIMIDGMWLPVDQAADVAHWLGLDFVPFRKIPATEEALNAERDRPSEQAVKCGITTPMPREGIVCRPLVEMSVAFSADSTARVIVKHKGEEFSEKVHTPRVHPGRDEILIAANAIAAEWVTPLRLAHVIDHLKAARGGNDLTIRDIRAVLDAMVEDVEREAKGEIVESGKARSAICRDTALLFKKLLSLPKEG